LCLTVYIILFMMSMHNGMETIKLVKSAFVRTTQSTLYLCNAVHNIAQNILHIHKFLKVNDSTETTRGYGRVYNCFVG
jgi:hypothetical protein